MLAEIEAKILQQLEPVKTEFNCAVQSLNDGLYGAARTSVYLSFRDIESKIDTFNYTYTDTIRFEVLLKLNDLRSHSRAYPILERVREILHEFNPIPDRTDDGMIMQLQVFRDDLLPEFWFYQQVWQLQVCPNLLA